MAYADLRADLSCSICLSIYTDPVTLKCGHNFCQLCIKQVLDNQEAPGGYSCPECRERFSKRPALRKNITLCNIAAKMFPVRMQQRPDGTMCTYCIHSPVPASRACLHCEAFLCAEHLRVHSKSAEHVLLDPGTSMENRKCSIHRELLRYYCVGDAVCICMSCYLTDQHRGHQVDMLDQASDKKKENLRNVLEKLTSKTGEVNKKVEGLQEEWRKIQVKTAAMKQRATAVFRDIKSHVGILEEEVMDDISQQENWASQTVSDLIQQLEAKRDELAGKILHIKKLLNMEDPLTVLQDLETSREDFCDMKHIDDMNLEIPYRKVYTAKDLDESLITGKLQSLSDMLKDLKCVVSIRGPAEITLKKDNACGYVKVSDDLKSVCPSSSPSIPCYSTSCHHRLVLSTRSFSSGSHYWEVEFKGSNSVGVCSASIPSNYIEANNKSWWLRKDTEISYYTSKTYVTAIHNQFKSLPFNVSSPKIRIYLMYEAGQISFYELCTPIRHLHTFTAKFTEPLHAAFFNNNATIKIN